MPTAFIVRNGRDGFVEAHEAMRLGYDFNGYNLFHGGYRYTPFEVAEVEPDELPRLDEAKLFRTETGNVYKALN